jgi:catechol 2,3-dioxygenase-like lactoylglutathione lyase family enzyme
MKTSKKRTMIKTHLSLRIADLNRSVAFYRTFFGVPPHKLRPGYANFEIAQPPLKLALTEKPRTPGTGNLDHLGLLVADTAAVNAIKQRLESEGLVLVDEMNTTCCYAKQDKFWVRDPDDVEWEVYAITDDMLEFDTKRTSEEAAAVACCRSGTGRSPRA